MIQNGHRLDCLNHGVYRDRDGGRDRYDDGD
jgi:hypothetical protein